ncbi:MAG: serine hydrolase [Flavobacteriaceae bacterium]
MKKALFLILTLLLSSFLSIGQSKIEQLDNLLGLYSEYGQFNGSVLVAHQGKTIYKKGFGFANLEWNVPNKPDTKFRIGSLTKQFTAMLVMQLVEQGKLELNAPISNYLPNYPKPNADSVTIHHLLTHSSGIVNYTEIRSLQGNLNLHRYKPDEFVQFFSDSTLQFKPGTKFSYSNSGYFLLGLIIEKVTNKSYEQLLKENILVPLKMNNTGYDHHRTILKNRASGYQRKWNGTVLLNAPYLDMSVPYAAGAIYSTVEDLFLWDQALYTHQLLSKENTELLFKEHIQTESNHYGYGWGIANVSLGESDDRIKVATHGGAINGFHTLIMRNLADRSLIVLLNNTGRQPLDEINRAILGILYDKSHSLPTLSLANTLFEVINEQGISEGLKHFEKAKNSKEYLLKEDEMNIIGYRLLQARMNKEAIEVFKLNVSSFPNSGNVYDSLGEAYMIDGNKELAIKNYKKAVELDPTNSNGIETIKKLQSNK